MKTITREDIKNILMSWQKGDISAHEIHQWASDNYPNDDVEYNDWEGNEEESVSNEVLAALDMMDMNLTTTKDIPAFLEFLATPIGEITEGLKKLGKYHNSININKGN